MPVMLPDHVAVVTGGASGIGAEVVLRLVAAGAAGVVIADLDTEGAASVLARVEEAGHDAVVVPTDATQEDHCERAVDAAIERWGRIDVLVAAAGVSHAHYRPRADREYAAGRTRAPLIDTDTADWQRVLDVNLNGVMYANRAAARHMAAAGSGSIVNIASINARRAVAGIAPYCVSKAGVWMLTKCLSLELATSGVRVNAVGPGYIDTPMNAALQQDQAALARVLERTPLGRLGTTGEIADAVLFLASDEAAFVTGSMLCPDGGIEAASR